MGSKWGAGLQRFAHSLTHCAGRVNTELERRGIVKQKQHPNEKKAPKLQNFGALLKIIK